MYCDRLRFDKQGIVLQNSAQQGHDTGCDTALGSRRVARARAGALGSGARCPGEWHGGGRGGGGGGGGGGSRLSRHTAALAGIQ